MTPAETEAILYSGAAATLPCVVFDLVIDAIQSWQRKRAGVTDIKTFGWFVRLLLSVIVNVILGTGFAYLYYLIGAGTGNAYLVGAVLWLTIAIPLLATSRYQDDVQKKILATRILGWLFKTAAAAVSASYFLG